MTRSNWAICESSRFRPRRSCVITPVSLFMGGIVSFRSAIPSLSLLTAAMQPSVPTTLQSLDSSARLTIPPDASNWFYNPELTP